MKKVVVGLSGGVDSAYAAWLLLEKGYQVSGVFMRNWDDDGSKYCTAGKDFIDACRVADHLGIAITTVNFTDEYKQKVFAKVLAMLQVGLTPNPDVWCNSFVKFGALLDHLKTDVDYVATGHYAQIIQNYSGIYELHRAQDITKDQTYFLHQLNQYQLSRSLFPLGNMHKSDVRKQAKQVGLPNYNRPDSTGICFIGKRPFRAFLETYVQRTPGPIVTEQGKVIGEHIGLAFYTIGQRKGLGIGGVRYSREAPWYVAQKNMKSNELVVVQGSNHPLLLSNTIKTHSMHWVAGSVPSVVSYKQKNNLYSGKQTSLLSNFSQSKVVTTNLEKPQLNAIIRHGQSLQKCEASMFEEQDKTIFLRLHFATLQNAVTPGQFVVIYQGSNCLGGAVIRKGTFLENTYQRVGELT